MKTRPWLLVLSALVILLLWALWPRPLQRESGGQEEAKPIKSQMTTTPPTEASMKLAETPIVGKVIAPNNPTASNRQEQWRRSIEANNVPLDFYGEVIDQDGNPLSGVYISAAVRHATIENLGGETQIERTTDQSGRFDIVDVVGDSFFIKTMTKDGYEREPGQNTFGSSEGTISIPIVFKMWQTNAHSPLISGQQSFQVQTDGRPYIIDLTKGTISESGDGDLRVSLKYLDQTTTAQMSDWSSVINVIDGALLEESNRYSAMYSAPREGYTPVFRLEGKVKNGQRGTTGERRFYVRLKGGSEYGRIVIQMFAPYNDQIPGLIRLQYTLNPTGSLTLR
jgi:hypothetical protein